MKAEQVHEITTLLNSLHLKSDGFDEEMLQMLYVELKKMAAFLLKSESTAHTYQATDLVNEAYLRMSSGSTLEWQDRDHFFSTAVLSMRRTLVDHARKKSASRRIPNKMINALDDMSHVTIDEDISHIVQVDDALNELVKLDELQAKIVELRFFTGFSESEIAQLLDVSRSTIQREWRMAKLWLFNYLSEAQ